LRLEKLPVNQIAAALDGVRGSEDGDSNRPPIIPPDLTVAKKLPSPSGMTSWHAKIDPVAAPKAKLGKNLISLTAKPDDVSRILFSSAETGQVAILSTPVVNELSSKRMIKADRYDLTTGKHLGTNDLFAFEPPKGVPAALLPDGDLSPNGTLLMVKGP